MDINFFRQTRILDGGMGQELLARGMKPQGSLWSASALLNENYHDLLLNTHLDYIKAGAEVIVTNTFATRRVRLKENRKLIGMCGFLNESYGIDFGYRYSKDSWGKGLGFEAAKEVLKYGFSELGLEKVVGLTAQQNYGSIRILEKLGFKFEEKFLFNNSKALRYSFTRNKFQ